jgi:type IV secretory pathway VirB2 component (pilin)
MPPALRRAIFVIVGLMLVLGAFFLMAFILGEKAAATPLAGAVMAAAAVAGLCGWAVQTLDAAAAASDMSNLLPSAHWPRPLKPFSMRHP